MATWENSTKQLRIGQPTWNKWNSISLLRRDYSNNKKQVILLSTCGSVLNQSVITVGSCTFTCGNLFLNNNRIWEYIFKEKGLFSISENKSSDTLKLNAYVDTGLQMFTVHCTLYCILVHVNSMWYVYMFHFLYKASFLVYICAFQ